MDQVTPSHLIQVSLYYYYYYYYYSFLVDSMFYTNVTLIDSSLYCPLPDYPISSSSTNESISINDINYIYCNATADRGSFISQFISINESK